MDFNLVFACKRFAANQLLLEIRQHSTMCARVLVISNYGVDMWWENVSYTLYDVLIKRNCAAKISEECDMIFSNILTVNLIRMLVVTNWNRMSRNIFW